MQKKRWGWESVQWFNNKGRSAIKFEVLRLEPISVICKLIIIGIRMKVKGNEKGVTPTNLKEKLPSSGWTHPPSYYQSLLLSEGSNKEKKNLLRLQKFVVPLFVGEVAEEKKEN